MQIQLILRLVFARVTDTLEFKHFKTLTMNEEKIPLVQVIGHLFSMHISLLTDFQPPKRRISFILIYSIFHAG